MNTISILGRVCADPVYFCTNEGRDLTRFSVRNAPEGNGATSSVHHCQVWGPAALELHASLEAGDRLIVRGELRYRKRVMQEGSVNVPFIYVKDYGYLGR